MARVLVDLEDDLNVDRTFVHPGDEDFLGDEGARRADADVVVHVDDGPSTTRTCWFPHR